MIKRIAITIFSILMLTAVLTSAQESDSPLAYLFDTVNNDLIRVNADGSAENFSLGIEEGEWISQMDLSISHDGTLVAYCTKTADYLVTLIIRDIASESNRHEISFATQPACSATAFNEDDSLVALSLVHFDSQEDVPAGESRWSLGLISTETGETQSILQESDDFMPEFNLFGEDIPLLALVNQFDADSISFSGIPFVGMGGPANLPVYQWDIAGNTVEELPIEFGRVGNDYLEATGELVFPAFDENLPSAVPEGPLPQANLVNVMDADGTVQTIYQNEEWVIVGTSFINDGESVAVFLYGGFVNGELSENANLLSVDIVNRDGTVETIAQTFEGGAWVENISGGALIIYTPNPTADGNAPTQFLVWDGRALNQLGEFLPDYSNGWSGPGLVWVSPMTASTDLVPFASN